MLAEAKATAFGAMFKSAFMGNDFCIFAKNAQRRQVNSALRQLMLAFATSLSLLWIFVKVLDLCSIKTSPNSVAVLLSEADYGRRGQPIVAKSKMKSTSGFRAQA